MSIKDQIRKKDGVVSKTILLKDGICRSMQTLEIPWLFPPKKRKPTKKRKNDVKFRKNKKKTAQSYREGFCFGFGVCIKARPEIQYHSRCMHACMYVCTYVCMYVCNGEGGARPWAYILYAVILEFFIFSAARDLEFYCWGSLFVSFCLLLVVDECPVVVAMKLVGGFEFAIVRRKTHLIVFLGARQWGWRDDALETFV